MLFSILAYAMSFINAWDPNNHLTTTSTLLRYPEALSDPTDFLSLGTRNLIFEKTPMCKSYVYYILKISLLGYEISQSNSRQLILPPQNSTSTDSHYPDIAITTDMS